MQEAGGNGGQEDIGLKGGLECLHPRGGKSYTEIRLSSGGSHNILNKEFG